MEYRGTLNDGFIKSFTIDGSFDTITEVDSLEHDTADSFKGSMVAIDSTHFFLFYTGTSNDGIVKTFSVDGSCDNLTQIDSVEFDLDVDGQDGSAVLLDSTHVAVAYSGDAGDGFIKIFAVDGSYAITETSVLEHDTADSSLLLTSLVKIDSTHLFLAYGSTNSGTGLTNDGFVKTFSVDGSYAITQIDSLEHDATDGVYPSCALVDSTHVICAYTNTDLDGYVKVFSYDGSFDNLTEDSVLEFSDVNGDLNTGMTEMSTGIFVVAYRGPDNDGFLSTFSVEMPAVGGGGATVTSQDIIWFDED